MICPACRKQSEMAYSVLSHSFVCLESECGFELEMDEQDVEAILRPADELVLA